MEFIWINTGVIIGILWLISLDKNWHIPSGNQTWLAGKTFYKWRFLKKNHLYIPAIYMGNSLLLCLIVGWYRKTIGFMVDL